MAMPSMMRFSKLREHFSEAEIVELGAFIGFNIGYHTFFGTLKFYPLFAPDGRLVSRKNLSASMVIHRSPCKHGRQRHDPRAATRDGGNR